MTDASAVEEKKEGAFVASLKRTNREIKGDRAEAIGEDAQLRYKRQVEDLEVNIKRLKRQRENMLDMSPDNAMSLMIAKDFDSAAFVQKEIELGVHIRNEEIKLEIASDRYKYLFGGV